MYQTVEKNFGGPHCTDILGLQLDTEQGSQVYINDNKIDQCQEIIKCVADTVNRLLNAS